MAEVIRADAMAVHLNPLQELLQPEGDRRFSGVLKGIERLVRDLGVPVIVKEVGCGISAEVARRLAGAGVRMIDVAGAGGTSWAGIESFRGARRSLTDLFWDWGIPTADSLREVCRIPGLTVIASGGIDSGITMAKALAMGADAVSIGQGVLIALGCNHDSYYQNGAHHDATADYAALGTAPGFCHHCHTGKCPVGITTQDAVLEQRLTPEIGARHLKNYLKTLNMELTTIARACGKQNVHHLEREDLVALTLEAAAMARVPLAGTSWIPGVNGL